MVLNTLDALFVVEKQQRNDLVVDILTSRPLSLAGSSNIRVATEVNCNTQIGIHRVAENSA